MVHVLYADKLLNFYTTVHCQIKFSKYLCSCWLPTPRPCLTWSVAWFAAAQCSAVRWFKSTTSISAYRQPEVNMTLGVFLCQYVLTLFFNLMVINPLLHGRFYRPKKSHLRGSKTIFFCILFYRGQQSMVCLKIFFVKGKKTQLGVGVQRPPPMKNRVKNTMRASGVKIGNLITSLQFFYINNKSKKDQNSLFSRRTLTYE